MCARLLALLAICGLLSVARADASLESARAQFRAGLTHAAQGDWPGALLAFTAAYELAPRPRILFNVAGAQLRCGRLLAANTNYRRALATGGAELSRTQRAAAERQLVQIETRIPRLRVRIDRLSPNDRVLLDRSRLYPDELDRDMWVDPGPHELSVFRAGAHPETRSLVLAEGERRVLILGPP
jgi:hypothetical protein